MSYADPEKQRAWVAANRDKINANNRAWRERNADAVREGARVRSRESRQRNPARTATVQLWTCHGMRPDAWAAMWNAQDGRCCLCGRELNAHGTGSAKVVIDHDHSHCPANRSCPVCRRGLAHHRCNIMIGLADDNPELLRRAADGLEASQRAVELRKTVATAQLALM